MSELINNREHRQKLLKEVIKELHDGKTVEEVQEKFNEVIKGVSPVEISNMEQQLVKEGLPISEIQRLCDVHASVFKDSLMEYHHPDQVPGHPIYTLRAENNYIEKYIDETIYPNIDNFQKEDTRENILKLLEDINLLWDIDKHYSVKENLIFPYLEKYGITAPPKVMWGVDDEIRALIKDSKLSLRDYKGNKDEVAKNLRHTLNQVKEMIFKEEKILFPMALETLSEDEWIAIYKETDEVGYAFIPPEKEWEIKRIKGRQDKLEEEVDDKGYIKFDTGYFTNEELSSLLNAIPAEITFTDKNNIVKYFSKGDERIFTRTKAAIGRNVENCHPPASVDKVDKIISDFKSGAKDNEDFWIQMGDKLLLIRFFAIRNKEGQYLGTLEFVQNIKPLQELTGEKRLLSE